MPETVWEEQFDGFNNELAVLATTDWRLIEDNDLWYYLHNLSYMKLQPDVFNYLFPVCLNFWYQSLMRNDSTECGDAEFHYSLYRGNILDKMISKTRRDIIYAYFHDGFIDRLEVERGYEYCGSSTPAYTWINRFNSIGYIAPIIDRIWTNWWSLKHPGTSVSAVMYASGLIYLKGENPVFGEWTCNKGGGGPCLTASDDSIYDIPWLPTNLDFLKNTLSVDYIQEKMHMAATALSSEPEGKQALKLAQDSLANSEILAIRIDDLIDGLSKPAQARPSWER